MSPEGWRNALIGLAIEVAILVALVLAWEGRLTSDLVESGIAWAIVFAAWRSIRRSEP